MNRLRAPYLLTAFLASVLLAGTSWGAVVFNQDFSNGGVAADYMTGGSASGTLFTDIGDSDSGGAGTGFTQIINSGTLRLESNSTPSGAMGMRYAGGVVSSSVYSFSINVNRTNSDFDFAPMADLRFGNNSGAGSRDYDANPSAASMFAQFTFRATGTDYQIENNGNGSANGNADIELTYGNTIDLMFYMNDSGASINFTGPDSLSHTVGDQRFSFFYNDGGAGWTLGWDNIQGRGPFLGNTPDIEGFNFNITKENVIADVDNVSMTDAIPVPEPSTWALIIGSLTFVGTVLVRRRKRLS